MAGWQNAPAIREVPGWSGGSRVTYLRSETAGLFLPQDSTAILHTFAGVQLWLHGPRHQGPLTEAPSRSNRVEARAFSSPDCVPPPDQRAEYTHTSGSDT